MRARRLVLLGLLPALSLSCKQRAEESGTRNTTSQQNLQNEPEGPNFCVAVRGNGPKIFAHVGAMARLIEAYGVPEGIAGGSSGSIMTFWYESMALSKALNVCQGTSCSKTELDTVRKRMALMMKSLQGYFENISAKDELATLKAVLGSSPSHAANAGAPQSDQAIKDAQDAFSFARFKPFLGKDETSVSQAVGDSFELLNKAKGASRLAGLINPMLRANLVTAIRSGDAAAAQARLKETRDVIGAFGKWDVPKGEKTIFIREPLLNWDKVAELMGVVGDFYAGMGYPDEQVANMRSFLDACSDVAVGKTWSAISGTSVTTDKGPATCGELFAAAYRIRQKPGFAGGRLKQRPGEETVPFLGRPLALLTSTALLTGKSMQAYEDARKAYRPGETINFAADFDDMKFGYWGTDRSLNRVENHPEYGPAAKDPVVKTAKFMAIRGGDWAEVLSTSPAEPGLANIRRFTKTSHPFVSVGGWSDLSPSLVLDRLGCQRIAFITRPGPDSTFAEAVAHEMARDEAQAKDVFWKMYDLKNEKSAINVSLKRMDVRVCTDWDGKAYEGLKPEVLFRRLPEDTYSAPMYVGEESKFKDELKSALPAANAPKAGAPEGCAPI